MLIVTLGLRRLNNWFKALPIYRVLVCATVIIAHFVDPTYDGKQDTNHPHAQRVYRKRLVIAGRHDSANLGEWRLVGIVIDNLARFVVVNNDFIVVGGDLSRVRLLFF